jgi:hypothetical protein
MQAPQLHDCARTVGWLRLSEKDGCLLIEWGTCKGVAGYFKNSTFSCVCVCVCERLSLSLSLSLSLCLVRIIWMASLQSGVCVFECDLALSTNIAHLSCLNKLPSLCSWSNHVKMRFFSSPWQHWQIKKWSFTDKYFDWPQISLLFSISCQKQFDSRILTCVLQSVARPASQMDLSTWISNISSQFFFTRIWYFDEEDKEEKCNLW